MSLPNLANNRPVYSLTIPSTQEKIKYNPYTKNQEKIILIASQEKNYSAVIDTLSQIMFDCTKTTVETVADFTYVMTNIRAKSHGDSHDFTLKRCVCGEENIKIHVENIVDNLHIKNQDKLKSTYKINDNTSLRLCPTKIDLLKNIDYEESLENSLEQLFAMIAYSVEYVVHDEKIIKEFSIKELTDNILRNLTSKQIEEINKEIGDMISVRLEVDYVCPKCQEKRSVEINDFLF